MTKKEFGRGIAFLLAACVLLLGLCEVFELNDTTNIATRFKTFGDLNENTVDAVWIGTSGVDRFWVSPKAYEEYGMTVFPLASDGMPSWLFTNVIDEICENQSPELIILDMRAFRQDNVDAPVAEVRARRILDAMDFFSVNRFKAALKTMDIIHRIDEDASSFDLSFLLSYIKYHSMWEDEDFFIAESTSKKRHSYMGFYMNSSKSLASVENQDVVFAQDSYEPLDPISVDSLYEVLDYAERKGINLLFMGTPEMLSDTEIGQVNTLTRMLDEAGADYIHYYEPSEDGGFLLIPDLDPDSDFYDENHVNYYGAEKFTAAFAAYLDEHYDFADRRADEAAASQWDGVYQKVVDRIAGWENGE